MDTGESVKLVPASCTKCGGTVNVDPQTDMASCPFCGTSFIVERAINNYNVQHATIEHADNVNIDMTGTVKTVLGFVGEQMDKSRAEKREFKREAVERDKMMSRNFFKMFGIMFAAMMVFGLISFVILQFTGSYVSDTEIAYSDDSSISCYIDDDGRLSVNITDPGESEWYYDTKESTAVLYDKVSDFDGYHFTVEPSGESGTEYAVVDEYENGKTGGAFPASYGIVRFLVKSGKASDIVAVVRVTDLSRYNFDK